SSIRATGRARIGGRADGVYPAERVWGDRGGPVPDHAPNFFRTGAVLDRTVRGLRPRCAGLRSGPEHTSRSVVVRSVRRAQAIPRSGGSVSVVAHAGPPGDGRVADQGGDRLYRVNASLYPVEPAGILEERRLAPVPAAVPDGRTELSVVVGGC